MGLKIKNLLVNILLLVTVLIIIYIAGEFITRIMLYKDGNPFRIDYNLNSEGFRDYDHNLQKPNGTFRITVLGDSFTFGQGVYKVEDTNPKKLEELLNKSFGKKKYEVFNFGERGINTKEELKILKDYGLKYKPDLVIINFYIDDADFKRYKGLNWIENKEKQMYPFLEMNNKKFPHFYYFILKKLNSFVYRSELLKHKSYLIHLKEVYQSKNWEEEKNILKEIKILSEKNDFKIAIIIFPILNDQPNKAGLKETYSAIQKDLEQEGFPILNLYNSYNQYNFKSLWISAWDSHPNGKGHEIAAKAIYNFLIEKNLLPNNTEKHPVLQV